ncbi:hypothetical protein BDR26DRAFT_861760 [Obelidium mucronatum]|nr:hypothetical protein BDR26DRAFT_861760 [Obelidium mucronatum]
MISGSSPMISQNVFSEALIPKTCQQPQQQQHIDSDAASRNSNAPNKSASSSSLNAMSASPAAAAAAVRNGGTTADDKDPRIMIYKAFEVWYNYGWKDLCENKTHNELSSKFVGWLSEQRLYASQEQVIRWIEDMVVKYPSGFGEWYEKTRVAASAGGGGAATSAVTVSGCHEAAAAAAAAATSADPVGAAAAGLRKLGAVCSTALTEVEQGLNGLEYKRFLDSAGGGILGPSVPSHSHTQKHQPPPRQQQQQQGHDISQQRRKLQRHEFSTPEKYLCGRSQLKEPSANQPEQLRESTQQQQKQQHDSTFLNPQGSSALVPTEMVGYTSTPLTNTASSTSTACMPNSIGIQSITRVEFSPPLAAPEKIPSTVNGSVPPSHDTLRQQQQEQNQPLSQQQLALLLLQLPKIQLQARRVEDSPSLEESQQEEPPTIEQSQDSEIFSLGFSENEQAPALQSTTTTTNTTTTTTNANINTNTNTNTCTNIPNTNKNTNDTNIKITPTPHPLETKITYPQLKAYAQACSEHTLETQAKAANHPLTKPHNMTVPAQLDRLRYFQEFQIPVGVGWWDVSCLTSIQQQQQQGGGGGGGMNVAPVAAAAAAEGVADVDAMFEVLGGYYRDIEEAIRGEYHDDQNTKNRLGGSSDQFMTCDDAFASIWVEEAAEGMDPMELE